MTTRELLIAKADALFEQEDYKQIYDLLNGYKVINFIVFKLKKKFFFENSKKFLLFLKKN